MFVTENQGYTRGGLDITTAVNLFFKFLLLSPVFLLAGYVSLAMMKHVIFHGIPSMNKPTEVQQQILQGADEMIGVEVPSVEIPSPPVLPVSPKVSDITEDVPQLVEDSEWDRGLRSDGCYQWALANPSLAQRLVPGESCYEIVEEYFRF